MWPFHLHGSEKRELVMSGEMLVATSFEVQATKYLNQRSRRIVEMKRGHVSNTK
jgi:hypothetical protein